MAGVLRVAPGQRVRAFDGRGLEAEGEVTATDPFQVTLNLAAPVKSEVEAELAVTVAVALLKSDKLSDVVRQGTELGAVRFRPVYESARRRAEPVGQQARAPAPRRQGGRQTVPAGACGAKRRSARAAE